MEVQGSWFAVVVAELRRHRADGLGFDHAWSKATHDHPPRAKDDYAPRLFGSGGEETVVGFFRRHCENAFYGTGEGNLVALRMFRVEMLADVDTDVAPHAGQRATGQRLAA